MATQYINPAMDPSQYPYSNGAPPQYSNPPPHQQYANIPPPMSDPTSLMAHRTRPGATSSPSGGSRSGQQDGKEFSLVVRQQPDRARMCGFGDKDRRPITPPPCVELLIKDLSTGRFLGSNDVDYVPYVLNVDLWDGDARQEVNLVRSSNSAPTMSISMATTTAYPPPPDPPTSGQIIPVVNPHTQQWSYQMMPPGSYQPSYGAMPQPIPSAGYPMPGRQGQYPVGQATPAGTGMFTRNLIGSVAVSASSLTNLENKMGIWFVLQDLSVRQEGTFRLKLSFINVGGSSQGSLNTGACPILAEAFSEPFTVWSAKKFPGVKESTPLSKHFAAQGVKIPIRKDNAKGTGSAGGGDQDDED